MIFNLENQGNKVLIREGHWDLDAHAVQPHPCIKRNLDLAIYECNPQLADQQWVDE
jgi:hypothetical protein